MLKNKQMGKHVKLKILFSKLIFYITIHIKYQIQNNLTEGRLIKYMTLFLREVVMPMPVPTGHCHVMYYQGDKKYPCLVGIGQPILGTCKFSSITI